MVDEEDRKAVLSAFFQRVADAFMSGDHEWLSGIYIYPLVVYLDGNIFLERTPEQTLASLFKRREAAYRAGTNMIRSTVIDVGPNDAGRFPVRVDWDFLAADGSVIARNELRYFCRFDAERDILIEILEFISRGIASPKTPEPGLRH